MSGTIVAGEDEDVWVVPVAEQAVAGSRMALVVDEPEMALMRLPKGKRRRTGEEEGSEVEESEAKVVEEGIIVATSIPRKPRGMVVVEGAPVGPRRGGLSGRGVVNPRFPMFFNQSRRIVGDHEKWPVRRGG